MCELMDRAVDLGGNVSGLIDTDGSLSTWPQVSSRVRRLAQTLVASGVEPGDRICIAHPRSTASFVAVHATLHAGAVMVPLDPLGPSASLISVIEAVEPVAIIGASATLAKRLGDFLPDSNQIIVHNGPSAPLTQLGILGDRLISFDAGVADADSFTLPHVVETDMAYIIFTSGSTGVPKGIVHTHASGLACAKMGATAHGMTPTDRLAATTPLHFDISTLDLYGVPWAGASAIAVTEAEVRFPASLAKRLATTSATMIFTTPYQLLQLAGRGDIGNCDLTALRQIAFGGEAFAPGALVELAQTYPPAELLNVYGPAEVYGVTVHSFGVRPSHIETVSIGVPCPEVQLVIVDDSDTPVPAGVSGEMLVHSPTMMNGYWRRDDLNSTSFLELDGTRFYRTGDLAYLDSAGLLQFEGRRDNRIKVRGVRIELEEIERVLEDAPGVAHAVAGLVHDASGIQHIAAWVVPQEGEPLDAAGLAKRCRARLPANAVPTSFVQLKSMPTTATGKIDRATLRASAVNPGAD